jgi:hypothetical protein
MNFLKIIPVVLLLAGVIAGCDFQTNGSSCNGGGCIKGSGTVVTQTRPVGSFTAIRLNSIGSLVVERTGTNSVTVETDDNLQSMVTSEIKNDTLILEESACKNCSPTKIAFKVTISDLQKIALPSVGSAEVSKLDGPALSADLSGTGSLKLSGQVDDLKISSSGTGSCDAGDLTAKRATVVVSGVGDVRVNASETLDAKVSGVGKIRYLGSPKLTKAVSGVGSIEPEGK